MPLFYQQNINQTTRLAIWKIEETEDFFSSTVPLNNAITHPHKRLQHYAGRFLLRYLFPDFPYEEILIADTRKPFLPNKQYHFSISHCGDFAAAIVSSKERVGIDIEIPTERVLKIAQKFLSEEERSAFNINRLTTDNQLSTTNFQLVTLLWSAKEAIFKWWGNGEVDFSEMMQLHVFAPLQNGKINAVFIPKNKEGMNVELDYVLFQKICLSWINTVDL